jgi:hypothetical protein
MLTEAFPASIFATREPNLESEFAPGFGIITRRTGSGR